MNRRIAIATTWLALAWGPFATAEPQTRILRVLGETTTPGEALPARFVIDAVVKQDDGPFKAEVDGWMAELGAAAKGDQIQGPCVEARCALSMDWGYEKLALSADLAGPGAPGEGRLVLSDGEGRALAQSPVRFSVIAGPVAGLGELAPADAVMAGELSDLLLWSGSSTGFGGRADEPVDWLGRRALAEWQEAAERPGGGLILVEDLALLRRQASAAKAAAGWTTISGEGWTAGYPAALLPKVETSGSERRLSSADGGLRLVISTEPAKDDAQWEAFVDGLTEDKPGVDRRGYTRMNDDMEIDWVQAGRRTSAAYHSRKAGFVRLEYSRPDSDEPDSPDMGLILQRSLNVADD